MQAYIVGVLVATLGIFGVSSWTKLHSADEYRAYRAGLRATGLLPESVLGPFALALAVAEVVAAVAALLAAIVLIADGSPPAWIAIVATVLAAAVMAVLLAGVALTIRRGSGASCRCFGAGGQLGRTHLVRNACLFLALVAAVVLAAVGTTGSSGVAIDVVAAVAGAVAALIFIYAEDIVDLFTLDRPVPAGRR